MKTVWYWLKNDNIKEFNKLVQSNNRFFEASLINEKDVAELLIDLSKKYQHERDTKDAPDNVINNLISFDPQYIDKTIEGITNIKDKALFSI